MAPLLAPVLVAEYGSLNRGTFGGAASGVNASFTIAGLFMGVSSFGLGFRLLLSCGLGFALPSLRNANRSASSPSVKDRRLTTGHLLHQLLHLMSGEERGCADLRNRLRLAGSVGKGLPLRQSGENRDL
jgi:hypothetical protein